MGEGSRSLQVVHGDKSIGAQYAPGPTVTMRVSSPPSPRPLGAHLCGRGSADRETVAKTWSRDAILCALALALALVAFGCASKPPFVWATSLPPEPPAPSHGVVPVHAGDTLAIAVRGHDSLGGTHVVGLEGYILA